MFAPVRVSDPCRVARARRRRRDRIVPAPPQLDSGALRGPSRRLSEHREKQLRAQGGAKVRSRITRLLGIALRNFRRARVERTHAEWQRLEAAAATAAEAAAERERAFRSHAVCIRHKCVRTCACFSGGRGQKSPWPGSLAQLFWASTSRVVTVISSAVPCDSAGSLAS